MKKYLPCIVGILLGLCFLAASVPVLFNLIKIPPMPEGTPAWLFMEAFVPTGYVKFVKLFEFTGGIVVMIPRLRNVGLLLLGPVIVNIIAFHVFLAPSGIAPGAVILLLEIYLAWAYRKQYRSMLTMRTTPD